MSLLCKERGCLQICGEKAIVLYIVSCIIRVNTFKVGHDIFLIMAKEVIIYALYD